MKKLIWIIILVLIIIGAFYLFRSMKSSQGLSSGVSENSTYDSSYDNDNSGVMNQDHERTVDNGSSNGTSRNIDSTPSYG